jgi:hypothetical protein
MFKSKEVVEEWIDLKKYIRVYQNKHMENIKLLAAIHFSPMWLDKDKKKL